MLKFFHIPFASVGNTSPIPNDTQGDGSVSYSQGYGPDYALDPTGGNPAKRIERTLYNDALLSITTALQELQSRGTPDFITSALNGGVAYPYDIAATVFQPSDNKIYRNTVAANVSVPPNAGWLNITIPLTLATIPDGTTSVKGVVQLNDSDSSTSITLAATINQVTKRARIASAEIISAAWQFTSIATFDEIIVGSIDNCERDIATSNGITGGGTLTSDLALELDSTVVRTTGDQIIADKKTFSGDVLLRSTQFISRYSTQFVPLAMCTVQANGDFEEGYGILSVDLISTGNYDIELDGNVTPPSTSDDPSALSYASQNTTQGDRNTTSSQSDTQPRLFRVITYDTNEAADNSVFSFMCWANKRYT